VIRTAAVIRAAGALALLACAAGAEEGRYYPVQLHLHGSMSEGDGSMRGHNAVARELGTVDVLWWTDHDWRIAGHGHLPGFGFERRRESSPVPYRDTPWNEEDEGEDDEASVRWKEEQEPGIARLETRLDDRVVAAGGRSLRLEVASAPRNDDWRWAGITLDAGGGRLKAPLAADVEVELLVRPGRCGESCRPLIRLHLSRQSEAAAEIDYVLGEEAGEPWVEQRGRRRVGVVPLAAPAGQWTRLVLAVTHDALRLGLGGWDNSLRRISIGAAVRRGGRAALHVDELRVRRLRSGAEVLARAEEIAAALEAEHGLVNHVGLEVSYGVHLNVYLPRIEMPDFERYPHGMPPGDVVAWAHARGGVASYNHVFGTVEAQAGKYESRVRYLLDNRGFGADLLEVGYPHRVLPLARHLAAWDALSLAGVVIGGVGTSDSHSQTQGWRNGNNFVTWVWAASARREDLIAGLRSRRAFFGDPVLFRGELSLETAAGVPMGQAIRSAARRQGVVLRVTALPEGATVRWIEQGEAVEVLKPPAGDFVRTFRVKTRKVRFARAEVWLGERGIAFSNCLYFLPR
jgi:hypothetical protein